MKSTMIHYIPAGGLEQQEIDELWDQGVILANDWAYILILPKSQMRPVMLDNDEIEWEPRDSIIQRMLIGPALNRWHRCRFHGKAVGIGVAYYK